MILYQIENELGSAGSSQVNYMNHLAAKVRSDGITVPIFHNDKGRNGLWVPASSNVPGTVPGWPSARVPAMSVSSMRPTSPNRLTLENFYMTFGGTSWGWLPAPVVYTSYDYGAAISEARQLRPEGDHDEGDRALPAERAGDRQGRSGSHRDAELARGQGLRRCESRHRDALLHRDARPSSATTDDACTFPISPPTAATRSRSPGRYS